VVGVRGGGVVGGGGRVGLGWWWGVGGGGGVGVVGGGGGGTSVNLLPTPILTFPHRGGRNFDVVRRLESWTISRGVR